MIFSLVLWTCPVPVHKFNYTRLNVHKHKARKKYLLGQTLTRTPNAKKPTTLADGGLRPPFRVALEWAAGQAKARVPCSSMIRAMRRGLVSMVLGMLRCVQPLPLGLANSLMT